MFQGNNPVSCQVLKGLKVKSVMPGESGPALEVELKVRINLGDTEEELRVYMLPEEEQMCRAALAITAPSKEDKKPHTIEIKILRQFERSEYALHLDGQDEAVLFVADVKGKAILKIVGSELSLELTLFGAIAAAKLPGLAGLVGQNPTVVANAPQQLNLLDTDGVTPRRRSPDNAAENPPAASSSIASSGDPAPPPPA